MPLLVLSPDNISHVKRAMRDLFPHVRPTHRTEALTAGLSFRAYASLLAGLNPLAGRSFKDQFSSRLMQLGYAPLEVTPSLNVLRSPAMPAKPWVEFREGDMAANNRWFYECRRRDMPDITIETRRKCATLTWDCISRDPKHDTHHGEAEGAVLVRQMFARFQELARPSQQKPIFEGTCFVGTVTGLPADVARDIADAFFIMLTEPVE